MFESEGLSLNISDWIEEFNIKIIDEKNRVNLDLGPKSNEGHDYMFTIIKKYLKIENFDIGEVISQSDDDI